MADEPAPDWRLLAPHRPLSPGDDAYVARPTGGGDAIATWVNAGGSTILVSGPTGVGKSTELAHAAQALQATRVACLVQVDRMANMHRLDADALMRHVAARLVTFVRDEVGLSLSRKLAFAATGTPSSLDILLGTKLGSQERVQASGLSLALAALAEIERVSSQERIALLIDGLEKLLPGPGTREIFDALAQLPESVDLIVVIPWHAAFGGGTESILRAGERLHRVAALDTMGEQGNIAAEFFIRVLARRLRVVDRLPVSMTPLLEIAFMASGGIPRIFLQLMADAGTYARAKRGAGWPVRDDLSEAIADQEASFRRALLPGDTQAIMAVQHTDGRELDLERRVRLLAQGILLERTWNGRVSLEIHPLVTHAVLNPRS
ncbi:MAG TPA: AAA family ATPase [Kofleriaceae bacterium]|nr:AAA family ATPase [Kofleriaceae bacterium]